MSEPDPVDKYCGYLDKEMTIMGLLSAFSVAVPALVLDRVAGAKESDQPFLFDLWRDDRLYLAAGGLSFFLAALAFYLQRSHLAYLYGQLRFSRTAARYSDTTTTSVLEDADSWSAWFRYNSAFALLILGFSVYGVALFAPVFAASHEALLAALIAVDLAYLLLNWWVKTRHCTEDHPWRAAFKRRR